MSSDEGLGGSGVSWADRGREGGRRTFGNSWNLARSLLASAFLAMVWNLFASGLLGVSSVEVKTYSSSSMS